MRVPPVLAALPIAALFLTGCTAAANLTVPASKVASVAAHALEETTGVLPVMDCGAESVSLVVDTVVDCTATDESVGQTYAADVTITQVEGTAFSVSVQVADTPNAGVTNEASDSEATAAGSSSGVAEGDVVTVSAEDIAQVAVGALAPKLGYTPRINCSAGVELVKGNAVRCMFTDDAGDKSTVNIEITRVDGLDYSINAVIQ